VSRYEIRYEDEARFVDRDAWWFRVYVARDGQYLGMWSGVLTGRDCLGIDPAIRDRFFQAAPLVTAGKLRDMVEHDELRSQWEERIEFIPLGQAELLAMADQRPDKVWQGGELILDFDHPA